LKKITRSLGAILVASALSASAVPALATDGYLDFGYGVKAKGIGGAGVAFPQDSLAPAANPAGDAFVGNRVDAGLTYFQPDRGADLGQSYDGNATRFFFIPELGVNYVLTPQVTVGVAAYGNGGLNTDYKTPIPAFSNARPGIDLLQGFVAPTLTFNLGDHQAIGISPIIAYQQFHAHGLEGFGIQDEGTDLSWGGGVRIGYIGDITKWLTVGATWQSKVYTTRFHDYGDLFAGHGSFDIPSNFAGGFAIRPLPRTTIAFDAERILYHDVPAVGNELTPASFGSGLGSANGPGFGWKDVTALKTGIAYDATDSLTLRAGYNYNTQPIRSDQTFFNVLAPAVVQHHLTAGLTWKFAQQWELSAFYAHAFEEGVAGKNNFNNGNATLHMAQDSVGLALGWKF
jgi:long-chain fatty acid transport protein